MNRTISNIVFDHFLVFYFSQIFTHKNIEITFHSFFSAAPMSKQTHRNHRQFHDMKTSQCKSIAIDSSIAFSGSYSKKQT